MIESYTWLLFDFICFSTWNSSCIIVWLTAWPTTHLRLVDSHVGKQPRPSFLWSIQVASDHRIGIFRATAWMPYTFWTSILHNNGVVTFIFSEPARDHNAFNNWDSSFFNDDQVFIGVLISTLVYLGELKGLVVSNCLLLLVLKDGIWIEKTNTGQQEFA